MVVLVGVLVTVGFGVGVLVRVGVGVDTAVPQLYTTEDPFPFPKASEVAQEG